MTSPAASEASRWRRLPGAPCRRRWLAGTGRLSVWAALLLILGLAAACTSAPDPATGPDRQIAGLVAAWQQLDPDKAADFTSDSAAADVLLTEVFGSLRPDSVQISTTDVTRNGENSATASATLTWELPDAGSWSYPTTWTWQRSTNGTWLLDWSPAVVHPKLSSRQTLAVQNTDPQDGVMVDRNNNQIVSPVRVYSVVLLPAKVPDVAATAAVIAPILAPLDPTVTAESIVTGAAAALAEAAAPAAPVSSAPVSSAPVSSAPVSSAPDSSAPDSSASDSTAPNSVGATGSAEPTASAAPTAPVDPTTVGYTITNIREPDYLKVKAQLDTIPGLSVPSVVRNLPPTRDFAKALLAEVTPVASAKMKGTAGWKVIIVDSTGGTLETLDDHPAVPGERVTITLDSTIQQAAETAIAGTAQPAMLLAMQPSTGEILAVAQNAAANAQGTPALTGQYPPGSTFKVVTATAGLDAGLIAPGQPVDCPGQFVIDGREIHNAHDFALGTVDVTLAFAKSCNTTFAKVATQLGPDVLTAAATDYGVGLDFVMAGATTLTGKVPSAPTIVQRAESGFGQGEVLVTPFGALLMAATADQGTMPMPVLIRGTQTTVDKPAPVRSPATQQAIQTFMRAVIDEGTGAGLEQFGDIHAKTGTAEFTGADGATHAHAWTIGYRGDLAFVAMVVGGEDSIVTNQITAAWLSALPA